MQKYLNNTVKPVVLGQTWPTWFYTSEMSQVIKIDLSCQKRYSIDWKPTKKPIQVTQIANVQGLLATQYELTFILYLLPWCSRWRIWRWLPGICIGWSNIGTGSIFRYGLGIVFGTDVHSGAILGSEMKKCGSKFLT